MTRIQLRHEQARMSLWVPDKCSLLIGRGWARVPPQTQCTTTSAAEGGGEENKKWERKWEIKKVKGKVVKPAEEFSQTAVVNGRSLKSSRGTDPGDTWRRVYLGKKSPKQLRKHRDLPANHALDWQTCTQDPRSDRFECPPGPRSHHTGNQTGTVSPQCTQRGAS